MQIGMGQAENVSRGLRGWLRFLAGGVLLVVLQARADECAPMVARLVSVQGTVEVMRSATSAWQQAPFEIALCAGDSIRIGAYGRAALRLVNQSYVRLDQHTTLTVAALKDNQPFVDLRRGSIHVISRTRRPFTIRTPFVNAGVEGTEFLVEVGSDSATLVMVEGKLLAVNDRGRLMLSNADAAVVWRDEAPAREIRLKPSDAVQWSLYYPSAVELVPADSSTLQGANVLARLGRPAAALERLSEVPIAERDLRYFVYRADLLLRIGRVDEASADIDRALELDPYAGDPHALRAIVRVVRNDHPGAQRESELSLELAPDSTTALIAESYVRQARFDMESARAAAERAAALAPGNALVWARVAELRLAGAAFDSALEAADRSATLQPDLSRPQTILGFAHLVRVEVELAVRAFERAIDLDQSDFLPRLGRGIARIRSGALEIGREDIEIAAVLDPGNSLVRSYLGKAYHDEGRKALAATQFELAKVFDPNDPTPWFYDAILKQGDHRPADALRDVQQSIELNGNRAVYRSRLLLDEDLAARNARLASVYSDLGFDRVVLAEAYRSLALDPLDFNSHRLLADAFAGRPRHDVARVSEQLQAQLWQPVSLSPVGLQRIDERPQYLLGAGPSSPSNYDFDALFVRQGASGQVSAVAGGHRTHGDQLLASALFGSTSFSVGQYRYETDGFQTGWGFDKSAFGVLAQHQWSPGGTLFLEARKLDETLGDLHQNFFGPPTSQRSVERRDLVRVGARASVIPGLGVAFVASRQVRDGTTEFPVGSVLFTSRAREESWELLAPYRSNRIQLLAGVGGFRAPGQTSFLQSAPSENISRSDNAFVYAQIEALPATLTLDLGVSRESIEAPDFPNRIARTNTKFGLIHRPGINTVIRFATIDTLRRNLLAEQTIEPTHVAGFNQFFNDSIGTRARRSGLAVDHKFSPKMFAGLELTRRRQDIPQSFESVLETFQWTERELQAYIYWLPAHDISIWAEYRDERLTTDPLFSEGFLQVHTQKVPFGGKWFWHEQKASMRIAATLVRQRGQFRIDPFSSEFAAGRASFWLTDLGFSIGLPQWQGELSLDILNVFNRSFRHQETDVLTPTLARSRLALARLKLIF